MELWLSSVCTLLGIHCVIFPFSCCVCVLVWLMSIRVCTAVNSLVIHLHLPCVTCLVLLALSYLSCVTCLELLALCFLPCVTYLIGVCWGSFLHSALSVLNSHLTHYIVFHFSSFHCRSKSSYTEWLASTKPLPLSS